MIHVGCREPAESEEPERSVGGSVAGATRLDHRRVAFTDPQLRAGRLLQLAQPTRVVGVRVRVEEDLHVLDAEAELRDAPDDERGGLRIAAVDQDVALRPGDQERCDAGRADVIEIAGNLERLVRYRAGSRDGRAPQRYEGD